MQLKVLIKQMNAKEKLGTRAYAAWCVEFVYHKEKIGFIN